MGRAKHCVDVERSIIGILKLKGQSQRQISKTIGSSTQNFVSNALQEKNNNKISGRFRKTSVKMMTTSSYCQLGTHLNRLKRLDPRLESMFLLGLLDAV